VLSAAPVVPSPEATRAGGARGASALPGTGGGSFRRLSDLQLTMAFLGMVLIVVAIRLTILSDDD
jgi:hypothetical protein